MGQTGCNIPCLPDRKSTCVHVLHLRLITRWQGSKRVGTHTDIPLSRRVQLAVAAHIRHVHTDYDQILKGAAKDCPNRRLAARKRIEQACIKKLVEWRNDDDRGETAMGEMEEILREIIVISDDEDDVASQADEDIDSTDSNSRESSVEFVASRPIIREVDMSSFHHGHRTGTDSAYGNDQPYVQNSSTGRNRIQPSKPKVPKRKKTKKKPPKDRRGFNRYGAIEKLQGNGTFYDPSIKDPQRGPTWEVECTSGQRPLDIGDKTDHDSDFEDWLVSVRDHLNISHSDVHIHQDHDRVVYPDMGLQRVSEPQSTTTEKLHHHSGDRELHCTGVMRSSQRPKASLRADHRIKGKYLNAVHTLSDSNRGTITAYPGVLPSHHDMESRRPVATEAAAALALGRQELLRANEASKYETLNDVPLPSIEQPLSGAYTPNGYPQESLVTEAREADRILLHPASDPHSRLKYRPREHEFVKTADISTSRAAPGISYDRVVHVLTQPTEIAYPLIDPKNVNGIDTGQPHVQLHPLSSRDSCTQSKSSLIMFEEPIRCEDKQTANQERPILANELDPADRGAPELYSRNTYGLPRGELTYSLMDTETHHSERKGECFVSLPFHRSLSDVSLAQPQEHSSKCSGPISVSLAYRTPQMHRSASDIRRPSFQLPNVPDVRDYDHCRYSEGGYFRSSSGLKLRKNPVTNMTGEDHELVARKPARANSMIFVGTTSHMPHLSEDRDRCGEMRYPVYNRERLVPINAYGHHTRHEPEVPEIGMYCTSTASGQPAYSTKKGSYVEGAGRVNPERVIVLE